MVFRFCLLLVLLLACDPQRQPLEEGVDITWSELVSSTTMHLKPDPAVSFERLITRERIADMGPKVRSDYKLAKLALSRSVRDAAYRYDGALGTVDGAKVYVTTRERVAGMTELYRVIVQVLSQSFACFMRARHSFPAAYTFFCKDGRKVMVWYSLGRDVVHFHARHYDRSGQEL